MSVPWKVTCEPVLTGAKAMQRHKTAHNTEAQPGQAGSQQHKKGQQPETTLSKMKSRLQGGRFRMLNERLYTSQGQDAFSLMQVWSPLFPPRGDAWTRAFLCWL